MATLPQSDRFPDPPKISDPIALKLPIHFQPGATPTSYECQAIVPIVLKIPIVVQIEVLQKPPLCKPQAIQHGTLFAESVQQSIESNSAFVEQRSDAPLRSDSVSSEPLPITTDIHRQSNWFNSKYLSKLGAKLHHRCPVMVLAILLGSLLGAGCASFLTKHLTKPNFERNCAIASINSTP